MVDDILDFVGSYADIRAICGLNSKELTDATLALAVYRNSLTLALNGISGIYTPETEAETLEEIYDRPLSATDLMGPNIELFSLYTVADVVMGSVGLLAYKSMTDGKSNITRFSPESTYLSVRQNIKYTLSQVKLSIDALLGNTAEEQEILVVVEPVVDLVTGA